jgi:hypothetical protein
MLFYAIGTVVLLGGVRLWGALETPEAAPAGQRSRIEAQREYVEPAPEQHPVASGCAPIHEAASIMEDVRQRLRFLEEQGCLESYVDILEGNSAAYENWLDDAEAISSMPDPGLLIEP